MERLSQLLESAEQIVFGVDDASDNLDLLELEPTPIGPNGIQNIVQEIPFTPFSLHDMIASSTSLKGGLMMYQSFFKNDLTPSIPQDMNLRDWASSFHDTDDVVTSVMETMTTAALPTPTAIVSSSSLIATAPLQQRKIDNSSSNPKRSRRFQTGQWNDRYQELLQFREQHGHLFVPHSYEPNQKLAQWVKRYVSFPHADHRPILFFGVPVLLTNTGKIFGLLSLQSTVPV
jgi:hypothetical protein